MNRSCCGAWLQSDPGRGQRLISPRWRTVDFGARARSPRAPPAGCCPGSAAQAPAGHRRRQCSASLYPPGLQPPQQPSDMLSFDRALPLVQLVWAWVWPFWPGNMFQNCRLQTAMAAPPLAQLLSSPSCAERRDTQDQIAVCQGPCHWKTGASLWFQKEQAITSPRGQLVLGSHAVGTFDSRSKCLCDCRQAHPRVRCSAAGGALALAFLVVARTNRSPEPALVGHKLQADNRSQFRKQTVRGSCDEHTAHQRRRGR